jgi:hypothetical protein
MSGYRSGGLTTMSNFDGSLGEPPYIAAPVLRPVNSLPPGDDIIYGGIHL